MSFKLDFTGKRVFITQGTSGIGLGTAKAFHGLGATVAINARTGPAVHSLMEELGGGRRLIAAAGDIATTAGRQTAVHKALDRLGGLDILVNCTDRIETAKLHEISEAHWDCLMDINVKAAFFVTQACLPALKASKGSITNVASSTGLLAGPSGSSVYCAAKGAVVQMTRMLALHLAREGVRVNALCPGSTGSGRSLDTVGAVGADTLFASSDATPMGRFGTVEECAGAILYLAAPFATFTTGSILSVDGGFGAGH
jgi:meso-butanediol dehydrogenase/(S,S)-butanediol dehydrogenase/diacetyl reductase